MKNIENNSYFEVTSKHSKMKYFFKKYILKNDFFFGKILLHTRDMWQQKEMDQCLRPTR